MVFVFSDSGVRVMTDIPVTGQEVRSLWLALYGFLVGTDGEGEAPFLSLTSSPAGKGAAGPCTLVQEHNPWERNLAHRSTAGHSSLTGMERLFISTA